MPLNTQEKHKVAYPEDAPAPRQFTRRPVLLHDWAGVRIKPACHPNDTPDGLSIRTLRSPQNTVKYPQNR
eukprot:5733563-Amphidinium_carterae.1